MTFQTEKKAQGRLKDKQPVAMLDIGSNSIRMVIYERHSRALTPLYNEKSACALGQGVATTGNLKQTNIELALKTMRRFALVIKLMNVVKVYCVATSAVREAKNGAEFAKSVEKITNVKVQILSGKQEAYFAALGAFAGIDLNENANMLVGDLGGGSLELAGLKNANVDNCISYRLGVISLAEESENCLKTAKKIVKSNIKFSQNHDGFCAIGGGTFCAIGGSWRALAKLHQRQKNYPLFMIQNYEVSALEMVEFCDEIIKDFIATKTFNGAEFVNSQRKKTLPFAAVIMREILFLGGFKKIIFSTLGVREGYLYSLLSKKELAKDPLIELCKEMSILRARSPKHSKELIEFCNKFFAQFDEKQDKQQKRLQKAACLLSDIAWRGHPDYRGSQSVDLIAYGALVGISHKNRAFLSQILFYRYEGLKNISFSDELFDLVGQGASNEAKLIGAIFRVAFPLSAGMSGVLPFVNFEMKNDELKLILPKDLAFLDGRRLKSRLNQLAKAANIDQSMVKVKD